MASSTPESALPRDQPTHQRNGAAALVALDKKVDDVEGRRERGVFAAG